MLLNNLVILAAAQVLLGSPLLVKRSSSTTTTSTQPTLTSSSSIESASSFAGSVTIDTFPAANLTSNNQDKFPNSAQVGFPGPTATGLEPFAAETARSYIGNNDIYPLVVPTPYSSSSKSNSSKSSTNQIDSTSTNQDEVFVLQNTWGAYTPGHSVNSSFYGLNGANVLAPATCEVTEVHYYYRHGSRGPTSGTEPIGKFAAKLRAAVSATGKGFKATGPLSFLNTWTYKLNEGLLTPFGRKENFDLGVTARILYGHLFNSFTSHLPVFTTQSNSRMVSTAQNFAAGLFGIPAEDQYNLVINIEADGFNNTGATYYHCPNADLPVGLAGPLVATAFANKTFQSTAARLNQFVEGLNITALDCIGLLSGCAYETSDLGYSDFCTLFTEEEFKNLEYYYDLSFYYSWSFGSPVSAAQGLGFLQEFVSRLTKTPITVYNSTTNSTLDGNNVTFPLDQSFYADASHEVVILALMTALNLTSLAASGPLPLSSRPSNQTFIASQIVPFATNLVSQVLTCAGTKKIRFLVNDAVIPLTYEGCSFDKDGLCHFDTVVSALHTRIGEIDFEYDCFGNYTAPVGVDLNGRAPRN